MVGVESPAGFVESAEVFVAVPVVAHEPVGSGAIGSPDI